MRVLRSLAVVAALSIAACGETPPTITTLDVSSGPPHTLVMISGSNLDGAEIVWDPGTPGETVIPAGYPSPNALMFSVPPTAATTTPIVHHVKARNSVGESMELPFTVTPPNPPAAVFPNPRIDSVTLVDATFDGAGNVTPGLYVQGANFDVGAVVLLVNKDKTETEIATYSHKALRNDLLGVSHDDLGYPIYHFVSTVALPGPQAAGSTLKIKVRNLDGLESGDFSYPLPMNAANVDSDGDGLLDSWETSGYSGVNLPMLGADPYRRTVFVEVDAMPAAVPGVSPGLDPAPTAETYDAVRAMFRNAPFLNPVGDPGVDLILDTSGSVPYYSEVCFDRGTASGCADNPTAGVVKYSTLKNGNKDGMPAYFDNAHRDLIFHYAIWGDTQSFYAPGISDHADDFLITLQTLGTDPKEPSFNQNVRSQVEEFVHELGHDLGLTHGGGIDVAHSYKPNHWSVMSYTWETRTGFDNQFRLDHATCAPYYYKQSAATELPVGDVPMMAGTGTDYSSGMGRKLDPADTGPAASICSMQVKWDKDGNTEAISDVADWPRLYFKGPADEGSIKP
jgi:hypothetical protein